MPLPCPFCATSVLFRKYTRRLATHAFGRLARLVRVYEDNLVWLGGHDAVIDRCRLPADEGDMDFHKFSFKRFDIAY